MGKIIFYRDKRGYVPVKEYLQDLAARKDKDSRIKLNKIRDYVKILSNNGTTVGEPYIKHLDGPIWELRPLRDRIFFVACVNDSFLLLHHFVKKSQKTPKKELEQAKRNLTDFIERSENI